MNAWRLGLVFEISSTGTAFVEDAQSGEVFAVSAAVCDDRGLLREGRTVSFRLSVTGSVEAVTATAAEPVAA